MLPGYPAPGWATTQVYPANEARGPSEARDPAKPVPPRSPDPAKPGRYRSTPGLLMGRPDGPLAWPGWATVFRSPRHPARCLPGPVNAQRRRGCSRQRVLGGRLDNAVRSTLATPALERRRGFRAVWKGGSPRRFGRRPGRQ